MTTSLRTPQNVGLPMDMALPYFFSLDVPSEYTLDQRYIRAVQGTGSHTWGITTKTQRRGAYHKKYISGVNPGSLTVEFYEDHKGTIFQMMQAWTDSAFNPQKTEYYPTSQYQKTMILRVYSMENKVIRTVTYEECFPINVIGYKYSVAESTQPMIITVTFDYSGFTTDT